MHVLIRSSLFLAALATVLSTDITSAEDDLVVRDKAVDFLKRNVIGRTASLTVTTKIDSGNIEADFYREITFTNLRVSDRGFSFDKIYSIKQTNFDLDKDGKRILPGRIKHWKLVERTEVTVRQSTGRLAGISRMLSNSEDDALGIGYSVDISNQEGRMVFKYATIGHQDYFAKGGRFYAGCSEFQVVYEVKDGRLHRKTTSVSYRMDPDSLKKLVL